MPHGCLPQHKASLYVNVVTHFMAFDTTFHPLSFCIRNIGHTKPRGLGYKQWLYQTTCMHSRTWSTTCTKPCAHTQPMSCNTIAQKDTMIPYITQPRYPLNSHVLAIFFSFATIPAIPYYPEFTDRHSPKYGMLSFSLLFMTHTFFRLSFPHFHLVSQSHKP